MNVDKPNWIFSCNYLLAEAVQKNFISQKFKDRIIDNIQKIKFIPLV